MLTLRIWFLALDRVARLDDAVREHRELLEAIRDGDATARRGAMRRHVLGFERAIRRGSVIPNAHESAEPRVGDERASRPAGPRRPPGRATASTARASR